MYILSDSIDDRKFSWFLIKLSESVNESWARKVLFFQTPIPLNSENGWITPKFSHERKRKPLPNYIGNNQSFPFFDKEAYHLLGNHLDSGEFVEQDIGKITCYFYRVPLYTWRELLNIEQTIFDVEFPSDDNNNILVNGKDLIELKEEHQHDWNQFSIRIQKYAFDKGFIRNKMLFHIDLSELTQHQFIPPIIFSTANFKEIVVEQKLTGFHFRTIEDFGKEYIFV